MTATPRYLTRPVRDAGRQLIDSGWAGRDRGALDGERARAEPCSAGRPSARGGTSAGRGLAGA